ncbi:MAG: type 4a pilus biogenesis protein PilO [Candidatus Omnitrophota bacterium]|nr:type 4a pilus biogenesis protein PilO [Candidatus Omnitrophota bacterium]
MKEKIEAPELINKYKKSLLNIAVILGALLIAFRIYMGQDKEITGLKQQKENEVKKNIVLEDIEKLEKKLNSYKKFLNKKDILESIRKLSNIAKSSSVNIISLIPQEVKETPDYTLYPFNLSILAQNYHTLAKFINKLEKDDDVYMIDLLSITPQGSGDEKEGPAELKAQMQLSTILYKD